MGEVLLLVALKTDQPNIERRLKTILAASEPFAPDTEPHAWAKPVNDLVAADLDALSVLLGWDAVSRLRVGGVAGGVSNSLTESGPTATTPALPADALALSCKPGCACGDPTVCGTADPDLLSVCPKCGVLVEDLDGFGVLAHLAPDGCGYCSHFDVYGDECRVCGATVND